MRSVKLRNISYSLIALAALTGIIFFISARADLNAGDISALYFWTKLSSLIASFGALILIVLRIFKRIDRDRNFIYVFFGTANILLGLCGVSFYFLRKINIIGLHDLLPNLLIGIVIFADLFLFDALFRRSPPDCR
ncbi:MAG TPA: hypothetical protein VGM30_19730 [Puia sp.]|jgi:hypothetical protein